MKHISTFLFILLSGLNGYTQNSQISRDVNYEMSARLIGYVDGEAVTSADIESAFLLWSASGNQGSESDYYAFLLNQYQEQPKDSSKKI